MKVKNRVLKMVSSVLVLAMMTTSNVFAWEDSFTDYTYKGTGYTTVESGSNTLVAKIDTYYYQNLRDDEYCAADVYFSKINSAGTTISRDNYGYAVARFERGNIIYGSSGQVFSEDGNAEAWSGACSIWNNATPHYYGNPIS